MRAWTADGLTPPPATHQDESGDSAPAAEPVAEPGFESGFEAAPEPSGEATVSGDATVSGEAAEPVESFGAPESPRFHVLIVGGGGTGAALAHDLVLRGLRVTLVERGEVTSGTSGKHHGLLHSGARYATTDRHAAIQCIAENKILRRIAPGSFEENDGLFVALTDEDAEYEAPFLEGCWQTAVPTKRLTREQALRMEPGLNPDLRLAVQVPDATMDAMRLPLRFFATARANGADVRTFAEVVAILRSDGAVTGVRVRDRAADREYEIGADVVVNAAGPWAGRVAAMAGVSVAMSPSPGVLVAVRGRYTNMIVNRLHVPGDGDAAIPQRHMTVLGTTSWIARDPDESTVPADHVERVIRETSALIPALATAEVRAAWTAVRPLIAAGGGARGAGGAGGSGRELPREIACIDHARDAEPMGGFVTIAGGKATTLRGMAEAAADTICTKLGVDRACETDEYLLLPHTAWYR